MPVTPKPLFFFAQQAAEIANRERMRRRGRTKYDFNDRAPVRLAAEELGIPSRGSTGAESALFDAVQADFAGASPLNVMAKVLYAYEIYHNACVSDFAA